MKKGRRISIIAGAIVLVGGAALFFSEPGKAVRDIVGAGFLEKTEKRVYVADHKGNLNAIYTALSLYHDSEGQYPAANGWMDAIQPRLKTNDLSREDAEKKLVRPGVGADGFGYSLSPNAAGKYKDDVKGDRILVSESDNTSRNASEKPVRGSLAVTVDGKIVTVP
ncbi:hypothetical protein EON81_06370 [bacterium]|nr:MAG: hypothetical protein EON81_06370 [bacterium]